jgi:hypothetical protein
MVNLSHFVNLSASCACYNHLYDFQNFPAANWLLPSPRIIIWDGSSDPLWGNLTMIFTFFNPIRHQSNIYIIFIGSRGESRDTKVFAYTFFWGFFGLSRRGGTERGNCFSHTLYSSWLFIYIVFWTQATTKMEILESRPSGGINEAHGRSDR